MKYYQVGKIFRFQNIISATICSPSSLKDAHADDESSDDENGLRKHNLCFYIRSLSGRLIKDFYPQFSCPEIKEHIKNIVLFRSGTEFMVCKR